MPLTIRCPACNAALKVKDEFLGRKIKCPKCTHVMPIPQEPTDDEAGAPEEAVSARKPAPVARVGTAAKSKPPAAPPPRRPEPPADDDEAPARRAKRDDEDDEAPLSFDELAVPAEFRKRVEIEIGDEPIVWMGRPDPQVTMKKAKWGILAGAIMCAVSLGIVAYVFLGAPDGIIMAVAGFFAFVLLVGGVLLLLTPMWLKKFSHLRAVYVLTDARALIVQKKMLKVEARVFRPKELQQTEVQVNDDGSGSIIMKYDVAEHSKTSYKGITAGTGGRGRGGRGNPHHAQVAEAQESITRIPIGVGFLDVLDVEAVDEILRRTLRLPPPVERAAGYPDKFQETERD